MWYPQGGTVYVCTVDTRDRLGAPAFDTRNRLASIVVILLNGDVPIPLDTHLNPVTKCGP